MFQLCSKAQQAKQIAEEAGKHYMIAAGCLWIQHVAHFIPLPPTAKRLLVQSILLVYPFYILYYLQTSHTSRTSLRWEGLEMTG